MSLDPGDYEAEASSPRSFPATPTTPSKASIQAIDDADNDPSPDAIDAIKESPPRVKHQRNSSEPRPLGEVIDEVDRVGSPSLRHVKGRLEDQTETFGHEEGDQGYDPYRPGSSQFNGNGNGNGVANGNGHGILYSAAAATAAPPIVTNGSFKGDAGHKPTDGNGVTRSINGDKTPETLEGRGEDESPRSPVRKAHKRISSRSLNGTPSKSTEFRAEPSPLGLDHTADTQNVDGKIHEENLEDTLSLPLPDKAEAQPLDGTTEGKAQDTLSAPHPEVAAAQPVNGTNEEKTTEKLPSTQSDQALGQLADGTNDEKMQDAALPESKQDGIPSTDESLAAPGQLVYENLRNKSGENLASLKPDALYNLSMQTRENKEPNRQPTSEPPSQVTQRRQQHARSSSELVSGRRAGAGWSTSAIRFAPLNVPLQRRLQTLTVLLHTLSIAGGLAIFFMLCTIPLLWPILLPYLLYVLFSPAGVDGKLYYRSERLRRSKVFSLFASYFPARLHRSHVLEPTRKYVFGYHPHGIISHGAFAAFATEALGFSQLFPGITNTLLTLDSNFRIPLYRDYALRMGLASVSRESCENILSKGGPNGEGMGRAITIVIGGARESLDAKPHTLKLVLKRRKGFVKLAVRCGADLVPVLAFGENDLYEQVDAKQHPHVHQMQLGVKKFLGFTVPLFHARGIFNYDVGLMPYRRPINIVVGKPIQVQQSKTPDPAYVDELHAKYVDELVRIWDEWKDTFARGRKGELEMVE